MASWPAWRKAPDAMSLRAMSLRDLWPSLPQDRVLFEDDDLIVIDKPAGASTHAPDARHIDDAVTRVKAYLGERRGVASAEVYLGVHQRLDRDTSGVLLFTKRAQANGPIARQFETRTIAKTYVAAVSGWAERAREGVLRHRIVPGDNGRVRAVAAGGRRGLEAITRFRVLAAHRGRALLELVPETGRTHQLRAQIAAMGSAIAGDRMYGNAPAPRLLLHASALALRHPTTGRKMTFSAPVPVEIERYVRGIEVDPLDDPAELARRLRSAAAVRFGLGRSSQTDAFRLAHEDADGLPGVAVDRYGDFLVVHLSSPAAERARERILDQAYDLGARGVYVKSHPKQKNVVADPRDTSLALAPSAAVRGASADEDLVIHEEGLAYAVRLGDGFKTGIFLDQRENRRRVRELVRGKSVLNLFAYTCAFTVAAAAGGAARTVSVDATESVLARGRGNLERNGLDGKQHELIEADVFAWLDWAASRGERFDWVILDPPSYASTHTSRFSIRDNLVDLASRAMRVVAPSGGLLACTNHRQTPRARFRRKLHEAARAIGRRVEQMKDLPDPIDFPPVFGHDAFLKSVLIKLE